VSGCLDAFAILAWLQDEPGSDITGSHLQRAASDEEFRCFVSIINLAEVYYRIQRTRGRSEADGFWEDSLHHVIPLTVVPATRRRVLEAARLKGRFPIALGDAFAAQVAVEKDVPLVTGDPEMETLRQAGVLQLDWIER